MSCRFGLPLQWLVILCCAASFCLAQKASTKYEGCEKNPSKEALDQARNTARSLPENELGVFHSQGTLERTLPLDGKDARDVAQSECSDLKPISANCWICCSTGKIFCKKGKSRKGD